MGLLREACVNGWRGRFYNAQALLDEPYASHAAQGPIAPSRRRRWERQWQQIRAQARR